MKRIIGRVLLLGISSLGISYAEYQQQGFAAFQTQNDQTQFTCTSQCIALIGKMSDNDYLHIKGDVVGNGILGYGFLVGQQVIPGEVEQIQSNTAIDRTFVFSRHQAFSQIPKDAQIVLIAQGNVASNNLAIQIDFLSFGEKIVQGWKDFRSKETLTPYSINLRYGAKINGISIMTYGYWIAILGVLYIRIFRKEHKEQKRKYIGYLLLGIFAIISIRNLVGNIGIVQEGLKNYTNAPKDQKTFFDLGDYITFTDKVRNALNLDQDKQKKCSVYIESAQDRPFKPHRENIYIKPCHSVASLASGADFAIYYKKTPNINSGKVLVEFNGSFLIAK